jgi:ATP-dependent Clp protease ATP-binding subunit ClpB
MSQVTIPLDPTKTSRETLVLEAHLRKLIVGQDEAVGEITSMYQKDLVGMSAPGRPVGSLLLLGPTGSGKTRSVEATAEALLNNPRAMTKIDCGEFQHSHEIAKLIGSPPGYLGHRETHAILSQEALDQYRTAKVRVSIVLFDEIEKASDALWNLLLGILDKAVLTLGDNRKVDFSRSIIFMTTNLGAAEMSALLSPKFGFRALEAEGPARRDENEGLSGRIERSVLFAVRKKFSPEFINRLDKIIVFQPLGVEEIEKILDIELDMVQQRILATSCGASFVFQTTEAAKSYLLQQGVDLKYGARHLKRTIERLVVQPLSNLIATSQIAFGDCIQIDFDGVTHSLRFLKKQQDTSPSRQLSEMMRRHTASLASMSAKSSSGNRAIQAIPMPLRRD